MSLGASYVLHKGARITTPSPDHQTRHPRDWPGSKGRCDACFLTRKAKDMAQRKLTDAQVHEIRRAHAAGEAGYVVLGRRYAVAPATIQKIVLRRTYQTAGAVVWGSPPTP